MNRWIQLFRLQTSGLTVGMMVLTRWVAVGVDLWDTIILALAGLALHAGFFGLNEWCDREHDKGNPHKMNPITDGRIKRNTAIRICLVLICVSLVILLAWSLTTGFLSLLLMASYVLACAYDDLSKKTNWSPVILAGWVFTLSMWIVGISGFPSRALWMPVVWFWMLLLQCLEGDYKDMGFEDNLGSNEVRLMEMMYLAQLAFGLSFLAVGGLDMVQLVVFIVGVVGSSCFLVMEHVAEDRTKMLRAMGLHNVVEYGMIVGICCRWVPAWLLVAVFLQMVVIYGVMNRLGYGSAAAPKI